MCRATREEEQAVWTATAGPFRSSLYDRRLAMKSGSVPWIASSMVSASSFPLATMARR
ncbi:hypothetical protein SPURM210S_01811 [Streptomyces purpurascens]